VQIAEIERARALVMRNTERLVITTADFPVSAFVSVQLPQLQATAGGRYARSPVTQQVPLDRQLHATNETFGKGA
jgi:hypothetical protein